AGNAGSGTEWGREPGLDTGSAAETWMDIVLLDLFLPKLRNHFGSPLGSMPN
ncbi:MAG: hypothetical protein K0S31_3811, partial [Sphingobacterium multivorum]|nr:hypothetical protein [Sphingobacterium multivorum]